MAEADILERMFDAIQTVLMIFSVFFSIVSGYLAALYLFLAAAPLILRVMAFALLSVGLVFLGGTAAVVQTLQEGLFLAWSRLNRPILDLEQLRNPIAFDTATSLGLSQQQIGVATGWVIAAAVYLMLAYLTFVYRWPHTRQGASAAPLPPVNSDR